MFLLLTPINFGGFYLVTNRKMSRYIYRAQEQVKIDKIRRFIAFLNVECILFTAWCEAEQRTGFQILGVEVLIVLGPSRFLLVVLFCVWLYANLPHALINFSIMQPRSKSEFFIITNKPTASSFSSVHHPHRCRKVGNGDKSSVPEKKKGRNTLKELKLSRKLTLASRSMESRKDKNE